MIVSFNFYYARAGNAAAVVQQRLRASEVRVRMGLPYGRVLNRITGSGDLPDVVWQHDYEDMQGNEADMAARAASPEFEAIRAGMRKLYRRFERPLFEVRSTFEPAMQEGSFAALDWVFCSDASCADVAATLAQLACKDPAPGRLLRLITPGEDLPLLVWHREYADAAACERAAATRTQLASIERLADRVEKSTWQVERAG